MVDDKCFWPEKVSVGEVIYRPGGVFGPRQQRNLQLIMLHSGRMTVWIDGVPRTSFADTVCVLFPGHEERFAFADECETWHSWLHIFIPQLPETLLARLARLPWPLQLSPAMTDLIREALALRNSPLSTVDTLLKALAVQMIWRYIGEGELLMDGATTLPDPAVENARQFGQRARRVMRDADIADLAVGFHVAQGREMRAPIQKIVDLNEIEDRALHALGRAAHLRDAGLLAARPYFRREKDTRP